MKTSTPTPLDQLIDGELKMSKVAKRIKIHPSDLSAILAGRKIPSQLFVDRIAEFVGMRPAAVMARILDRVDALVAEIRAGLKP
ncbi:MAG: XRE family transcriptional regulator [Rhodocyclaceae bacterium]|nr:MAG: XRE family transcriptional regulator [Rhodocyclaceae bacterium]